MAYVILLAVAARASRCGSSRRPRPASASVSARPAPSAVLLETIGTERIVAAMVVWSQVWAVAYLAGPATAGWLADAFGFGVIGLVPLAAALVVVGAFVTSAMPKPSEGRV